jgi:hypothetical protein
MAYAWVLNPQKGASVGWSFEAFNRFTGLPCPFCGGTRATHFLLHGDWGQSLYYNWLAIPSLAAGLGLVLIMTLELLKGRQYLFIPHFSRQRLFWGLAFIAIIWAFHVYDALTTPKPELLNIEGLYFKLKPENIPHSIGKP